MFNALSSSFSSVHGQVRYVHETTMLLLVTLLNIHRFYFFTHRLINKPFSIWLTTPPHLNYVFTLHCNFSLRPFLLTSMIHKVV